MSIRNPLCFARTIYKSIKYARYVSGCKYQTVHYDTPPNIHIIKCNVCGNKSVAWSYESLEDQK